MEPSAPVNFKFETRHVGLTYPKCPIAKDTLAAHLFELLETIV